MKTSLCPHSSSLSSVGCAQTARSPPPGLTDRTRSPAARFSCHSPAPACFLFRFAHRVLTIQLHPTRPDFRTVTPQELAPRLQVSSAAIVVPSFQRMLGLHPAWGAAAE